MVTEFTFGMSKTNGSVERLEQCPPLWNNDYKMTWVALFVRDSVTELADGSIPPCSASMPASLLSVTVAADLDGKDSHTAMWMRCMPSSMRILNEDKYHDRHGWCRLDEPASNNKIC
ncbi:unnamed protein product [Urochloa humidicola]